MLVVPIGTDDFYNVLEDGQLEVTQPGVLENDFDDDGDVITAGISVLPMNGVILDSSAADATPDVINPDGSFFYVPNPDFFGEDTFTYFVTATDADMNMESSEEVTVTIRVIGIPDPPIQDPSAPDMYVTPKNTDLTVRSPGVLGNDLDGDGDELTAILLNDVTAGTLEFTDDGEFTIDGTSFVRNGESPDGETESLGPVNWGIAAQDGATGAGFILFSEESLYTRFEENPPFPNNSDHLIAVKLINDEWHYDDNSTYVPFTPEPSDLLIAEVDFTDDTITSLEGVSGNENGIETGYAIDDANDLTFMADVWNGVGDDGSFAYSPEEDFVGSVTFVYEASDGNLTSGPLTVTIDVFEPFKAIADEYTVIEDNELNVSGAEGLLANDEGLDGSEMVGFVQGSPQGDVFLNTDGSFRYVPPPNFFGVDTFDYIAFLGGPDEPTFSEVVPVTINVLPVNDIPEPVEDVYETAFEERTTVGQITGFPKLWFGNGHYYEFVGRDFTWEEARDFAGQLTFRGAPGRLATITSQAEFDFLTENFESREAWIGGFQDARSEPPPDENWKWVTGEQWDFTFWGENLPDDVPAGQQNFLEIQPTLDNPWGWNDARNTEKNSFFLVEYDVAEEAVGVLANDIDVDNDPLRAVLVDDAINGSLTFTPNGHFQYTPLEGFFGLDQFTYSVFDGLVNSPAATVTVQVLLPGDADLNGAVDLDDFNALKDNIGIGMTRAEGDFNSDGLVDLNDFSALKTNFGRVSTGNPFPPPEPTDDMGDMGAMMASLAIAELLDDEDA